MRKMLKQIIAWIVKIIDTRPLKNGDVIEVTSAGKRIVGHNHRTKKEVDITQYKDGLGLPLGKTSFINWIFIYQNGEFQQLNGLELAKFIQANQ